MLLRKRLPRDCAVLSPAHARANNMGREPQAATSGCQCIPQTALHPPGGVPVCTAGPPVLQEGTLRCDVNVSVRPRGRERFGTKVEVKNMNSFSAMQKAIDFEISRQVGSCAAHGAAGHGVSEPESLLGR